MHAKPKCTQTTLLNHSRQSLSPRIRLSRSGRGNFLVRPRQTKSPKHARTFSLAEGVGFEPTVPLPARRFSRPFPSTTRTPFHNRGHYSTEYGTSVARARELTTRHLRVSEWVLK